MSVMHLTSREEELVRVLRDAREPSIVYLSEDYHPGTALMRERVNGVAGRLGRLKVMEFSFHACRNWAASHGVYGVPSVMLFREGALIGVSLGVIEEDELRALLERLLTGRGGSSA